MRPSTSLAPGVPELMLVGLKELLNRPDPPARSAQPPSWGDIRRSRVLPPTETGEAGRRRLPGGLVSIPSKPTEAPISRLSVWKVFALPWEVGRGFLEPRHGPVHLFVALLGGDQDRDGHRHPRVLTHFRLAVAVPPEARL
jgi:hypothetical protein